MSLLVYLKLTISKYCSILCCLRCFKLKLTKVFNIFVQLKSFYLKVFQIKKNLIQLVIQQSPKHYCFYVHNHMLMIFQMLNYSLMLFIYFKPCKRFIKDQNKFV